MPRRTPAATTDLLAGLGVDALTADQLAVEVNGLVGIGGGEAVAAVDHGRLRISWGCRYIVRRIKRADKSLGVGLNLICSTRL